MVEGKTDSSGIMKLPLQLSFGVETYCTMPDNWLWWPSDWHYKITPISMETCSTAALLLSRFCFCLFFWLRALRSQWIRNTYSEWGIVAGAAFRRLASRTSLGPARGCMPPTYAASRRGPRLQSLYFLCGRFWFLWHFFSFFFSYNCLWDNKR